MTYGGIDIGSRYIKFVLISENSEIVNIEKIDTGFSPLKSALELVKSYDLKTYFATGYGRHLLEIHDNAKTITEIKACATGSSNLFPECKAIIDIGGQDTKVITMNNKGKVINFLMNDKCAAGTGKFIEMMTNSLAMELADFSRLSDNDYNPKIKINSMCAVFAESEVISLITRGFDRREIASAIHHSVADKVISLALKLDILEKEIVFTGGCARNKYLVSILEERLGKSLNVSNPPDILSAYGAAIIAKDSCESTF
ncbi:MAG: activase [Candidatus Delongbacteria bacterium]|nr:activase [Candidatus Delongbacteria bacterium]MBN2834931.1 activase [Candidatus Delongbacteria bacterium]